MSEEMQPERELDNFCSESMTQYAAITRHLIYFADQRFKITAIYLIANGLLANVAKDYDSVILGFVAIVLSYLSFSWQHKTTMWCGYLIEALKRIESAGVHQGKLTRANLTYPEMPPSRIFLKPTHASLGIILLIGVVWIAYTIKAYPALWLSVKMVAVP